MNKLAATIIIIFVSLIIGVVSFIKLSPNLSFSIVAEKYVHLIAPWIYKEHFKNNINVNSDEVVGYVNQHSVQSGESFQLFLSKTQFSDVNEDNSTMFGQVNIYRIGFYGDNDRTLVYEMSGVSIGQQDVSVSSYIAGLAWEPISPGISTAGWDSGYFAIDFVLENGKTVKDVAFIVVTAPEAKGDILVKLSTNTYQAYNLWGGGGLYSSTVLKGAPQTGVVSFDRPVQSQFYLWEYYYVLWLERYAKTNNLKVDYATNYDFYEKPEIARDYKVLISLGHDEYWSQAEFDSHYERIFEEGKNTLFLSANTAYWRIRYGDIHNAGKGRQLICYRHSVDPIKNSSNGSNNDDVESTGLFRNTGYPETMLMGVGYESFFAIGSPDKYPYSVKTYLPWFFKGTDLQEGDVIGDLIGYEWDNSSLEKAQTLGREKSELKIPMLVRSKLAVLLEGKVKDINDKIGTAEAVYFESDAGAKVFSAGTIRWAWGVGKNGFVNDNTLKLNENLLEHFLM